jgi:hypothetical protein
MGGNVSLESFLRPISLTLLPRAPAITFLAASSHDFLALACFVGILRRATFSLRVLAHSDDRISRLNPMPAEWSRDRASYKN